MNILILGSGGREHAIGWAFADNPKCDALYFAPGNAGTTALGTNLAIDPCDITAVQMAVRAHDIGFVMVGPEAPLAAGVAEDLRKAGVLTLGPDRMGAMLEASKAFTKEICRACQAPTAAARAFDDHQAALDYLNAQGAPIVIKDDGLAAGKGVTVAEDMASAKAALDAIFAQGDAKVVIEEFMAGEEASLFVLCDGKTATVIGTAQDHKRAYDGDAGPNTGGMGAYSPAPVLTAEVEAQIMDEIVHPVLLEMAGRGHPFQGILYTGLMIENGRGRLVEFNVRFGDPEAQVIAMRLRGQMLDLFLAAAQGDLHAKAPQWADDHALTVVYAAKGYPGSYQKGSVIKGLNTPQEDGAHQVFHAGTGLEGDDIIATGGRVLAVTGRGDTLAEARDRAYDMIADINWPDGFHRSDIGWRALS